MRGLGEATFQTKRGADFVARVKDDFARVEIPGDLAYLTRGQYRADKTGTVGAQDFRSGFQPTTLEAGVNCDWGAIAHLALVGTGSATDTYQYPNILAGQPDDNGTYRTVVSVQRNTVRGGGPTRELGEVKNFASVPLAAGLTFLYPNAVPITYLGRVVLAGAADLQVAYFYLASTGRQDAQGRDLLDVAMQRQYRAGPPVELQLPLPGGLEDYEAPVALASKDVIYVLVAQKFSAIGARNPVADLRPAVWLLVSTDGGSTWNRTDIRAVLAADFDLPLQHVAQFAAGPEGATGFYGLATVPLVDGRPAITDTATYSPIQDYAVSTGPLVTAQRAVNPFGVNDHHQYNSRLSFTVQLMRVVMGDDNAAIVTFPYQKTIGGVARWKSQIVRISGGGAAAETTFTSTTTSSTTEFVQSLVYLGRRTLVAKKVAGFGGTGFAVVFMVSTDNGSTWADVAPVGFACPLENQYFGDLFVERASTAERAGRLLLVSFDTGRAAYFVFSSDDVGATWVRRGKVRTPDQFRRIDTMLDGDGGGNFTTLTGTGSARGAQPVDKAIPDRYIRKAQP